MGDGADGRGVSNPEREPSASGQGTGLKYAGPPEAAGAQRGSGGVLGARGSAGRCGVGWQGWGLGRLYSRVPRPFTGHSPARGWPSGRLGQDGPHAASSRGLRPLPFKPVHTSAQTLSGDSPWLPSLQCSQSLPLLPPTSLSPSPPGPQLQAAPAPLPQPRAPSLPPTQPCSAPSSPTPSRPRFRHSPSSWPCWPPSTG